MYSYEDRLRAVELYLKLGKRIKATIRQLGYPTKNSLKAWCEAFEKSGDLQKEYVRVKPKYSEEQKSVAVEHYVNHGRCFTFTLKAFSTPVDPLVVATIYSMRSSVLALRGHSYLARRLFENHRCTGWLGGQDAAI